MSLKVPFSMEVILILAICISYLIPVLRTRFLKSNPFVLIDKTQNSYERMLEILPICCSLMLLPCCAVLSSCFLLNSKKITSNIYQSMKSPKAYVVGNNYEILPKQKRSLSFFFNKNSLSIFLGKTFKTYYLKTPQVL